MAASRDLAAVIRSKDETSAELARIHSSLTSLEKKFQDTGAAAGSSTGGINNFVASVGKIATSIGVAELALRAFDEAKRFAFEATFGVNASIETATLQFEVLMGDADKAREHVADLFEFAKSTPFESEGIIKASRTLEVFGGAALNTKETLRLVGDAAAGASAPIEEVATWVARAYSAIQSGRPFGEAAQRLQELGLMSGESRARLEALSEAGVDSEKVWAAFAGELGRFGGSMEKLQATWAGLTSTAMDSINLLLSGALKPLFDGAKEGLEEFNRILETDDAKRWGEGVKRAIEEDVIPSLRKAKEVGTGVATVGTAGFSIAENPITQGLLGIGSGMVGNQVRALQTIKGGIESAMAENARVAERGVQELQTAIEGVEDIRLEGSLMRRNISEPIVEAIDEAVDDVRRANLADKMAAAFEIGDAAERLSDGGAALMKALTDAITREGEKDINAVEQSARKIMDAWLKQLPVEEARARGAELRAAIIAASTGEGSTENVETIIGAGQASVEQRRLAEEARKQAELAQREADKLKREQEAAVREAARLAEEWRRTMPITQENFASAFGFTSQAASFGPGKGLFEALTKVIETGGQDAIRSVAAMAADMAQKMRDEFGPEDGEAWAAELLNRVNQTIEQRTPESVAAVAAWVKSFDVESQLRAAGMRAATAVNEAIQEAERAIRRAQESADERIGRILEDARRADAREAEKGGLQRTIDTGLEGFRDTQAERTRGIQLAREEFDLNTRRGREDADREERLAKLKEKNAQDEKKLIEAVNEARFSGDSIAVNRAQKALEDRRKAIQAQSDDELKALTLRRQREDEDVQLRRQRQAEDLQTAKAMAAELQAERDRLFEASGMKAFLDRIKVEDLARVIGDVEKGRDEAIASINERLSDLREKTDADLDVLQTKLLGTRDIADTIFDGAIEDADRLITLFNARGGVTPGVGGGALNEEAVRAVTIGTLNVTNNGYMGEGGPEALAAEMVAAEEALIQ